MSLTLQDAREATERGEALPCRWCGGKALTHSVSAWWEIKCSKCGQRSSCVPELAEARERWNEQQVPPCA